MRTREEQISELRKDLVAGKSDVVMWNDMDKLCIAEAHILEAERRAEQRVRAEVGRDSERLDWLADQQCQFVNMGLGDQPLRIINDCMGDEMASSYDLREAIDAARNGGE